MQLSTGDFINMLLYIMYSNRQQIDTVACVIEAFDHANEYIFDVMLELFSVADVWYNFDYRNEGNVKQSRCPWCQFNFIWCSTDWYYTNG